MGEGFGPGEGEGVGGVEADGGDGEEDVLAWVEIPGVGEAEGYADGIAWEEFDVCTGVGGAEVAVEEDHEAVEALGEWLACTKGIGGGIWLTSTTHNAMTALM